MIVGGEMSQSKVCPLSSRLNISIWEAQQLFWKSGGVFLQTIFAQTSQIVRSHYCSAFTQSCGFQRSKVVGLIQCLARGGKTFMDMFWQTCGYFCFPGSELTKRMRRKKISETRPNSSCRNGSGAHLPPEGLASGSSGAPNYKAGARAHPRLSHPPPVKRGAGGRLSYINLFSFMIQFLQFFALWQHHSFQVLGIVQLDAPKTAHHVTQGDRNETFIVVVIWINLISY